MEVTEKLTQTDQIFFYLDDHPKATNKELYEKFSPKISKDNIRKYKERYLKAKKKLELSLGINLGIDSDNGTNKTNTIPFKPLKIESTGLLVGDSKSHDRAVRLVTEKISIRNQPQISRICHIFPLLKTCKIFPLWFFKKLHEIVKLSKDKKFMISDYYTVVLDHVNNGNYNQNEISDFSLHCKQELRKFLSHESWLTTSIIKVNEWLENCSENNDNLKEQYKNYLKIKGEILVYYLPRIYSIYYSHRKRELILRDFFKACMLYNKSNEQDTSLSNIIDEYNSQLDYRNKPDKYHIHLDFSEDPEWLYPQEEQEVIPDFVELELEKNICVNCGTSFIGPEDITTCEMCTKAKEILNKKPNKPLEQSTKFELDQTCKECGTNFFDPGYDLCIECYKKSVGYGLKKPEV